MVMNKTRLWTAIVTPMRNNGEINYSSFKGLLQRQAKAKCGVVLLGSTGEGIALAEQEKRQIIEFAANLHLNIPLLVGVGGFQLDTQLSWIEFCNQFPAIDGYLLVAPIYAKPGTQGQTAWFKALLDKSDKPCMLYNVPSRTGVNLSYKTLGNLSAHPNLWALKEASGDLDCFKEYQSIMPSLKIYSGEDGLMPQLGELGAYGLVSVVSNIWPCETKEYVEMSINKEIDEHTQQVWKWATKACFNESNPIPTKVWLHHQNMIQSATLRAPLTATDLDNTEALSIADRSVKSWFETIQQKESA